MIPPIFHISIFRNRISLYTTLDREYGRSLGLSREVLCRANILPSSLGEMKQYENGKNALPKIVRGNIVNVEGARETSSLILMESCGLDVL